MVRKGMHKKMFYISLKRLAALTLVILVAFYSILMRGEPRSVSPGAERAIGVTQYHVMRQGGELEGHPDTRAGRPGRALSPQSPGS